MNFLKLNKRGVQAGFTLVELLLVIGMIGVLTGLITVNVGSVRAKARDTKRKNDLTAIKTALVFMQASTGKLPVVTGPINSSSGENWIPTLAPKYMDLVPTDPQHKKGKLYSYIPGTGLDAGAFAIQALLETEDGSTALVIPTVGSVGDWRTGLLKNANSVYFQAASGPVR